MPPGDLFRIMVMSGEPWSKDRPQFGRRGRHVATFQTKEDRAAEKRTATFFRQHFPEPLTGNVAVLAIFHRSTRRVVDSDNLMKHVCDSGNGVLFGDDSQVTAQAGVIEFDPDNPRTVIAVSAHVSTMLRGTDNVRTCQVCRQVFSLEGKSREQLNCSLTCASIARRKDFTPIRHTHEREDVIRDGGS